MFCNHCGAQLPDGSKFCSSCGAQLSAAQPTPAPSTTPAEQKPTGGYAEPSPKTTENQQKPAKAPKKKPNIVLLVAIWLCVFLLGKFVIAPSIASDPGKDSGTDSQGSQSQQSALSSGGSSADSANSAYEAVFDGTYIVHFQTFFNMDMESFVTKQEDGIICCADYGYKDDVVKQWVETMYIPVSEYTDTQKTEVESTMRTQFAAIEALSCCSVSYKMSTNYLTITFTYSDVDKAENYNELYNAGILQTNTFISMSATKTALLNQGFIKK